MAFTLLIITAFIIWFSSLWIAILSLLSIIGGWSRLSRLYPFKLSMKNVNDAKYTMCSIKVGLVSYRYCAVITLTETGMILELIKIFSTMHKPLFIPYNKISGLENLSGNTKFITGEKVITISGKPGDELFSRITPK